VAKQIVRATLHGGFTEGADSDLTDAELRAAGGHRTARQLPTYAKRTSKQLLSIATRVAPTEQKQPICRNDQWRIQLSH
jgi:hypothetical protein